MQIWFDLGGCFKVGSFLEASFLFMFYVLLRLCDYHHLYWLLIERWYLRADSKNKSNPADESIMSPEPVTLTRLLYCSVQQPLQGVRVSCAKALRWPQRPCQLTLLHPLMWDETGHFQMSSTEAVTCSLHFIATNTYFFLGTKNTCCLVSCLLSEFVSP